MTEAFRTTVSPVVQFERIFDPHISFRADVHPHWYIKGAATPKRAG